MNIPEDTPSPLLQWLGLQAAPTITHPPAPAFQTPIAPQTAAAMVSWNPAQQNEAYAQRGVQYGLDTDYFSELLVAANGNPDGDPPNPKPQDNTFAWVLAGIVGFVLVQGFVGGHR